MAVVDREQLLPGRVYGSERRELLARIDAVADRRLLGHVRAADHAGRSPAARRHEAAALEPVRFGRMRDDLVADGAREDDLRALLYRDPPAIAGMTMTSASEGTAASRPPCARASASPMYTFT
jgi:hypothetical protein